MAHEINRTSYALEVVSTFPLRDKLVKAKQAFFKTISGLEGFIF
jgi:hypothetical protein